MILVEFGFKGLGFVSLWILILQYTAKTLVELPRSLYGTTVSSREHCREQTCSCDFDAPLHPELQTLRNPKP